MAATTRAAGAHAEAVDGAAVGAVMGQAVGRRAQVRMAGARAVARPVDPALRMLDADADGKRLGLDMDAARVQHLEGRPGAVADRQDDMVGLEEAAVRQVKAAQALASAGQAVERDVVDPRLPAVFAAQLLDLPAQALDHGDQPEGADMRVGFPQDVVGRARGDELFQHLAAEEARVLDPAIELAVGERARAAFAELDVGFGIELRRGATGPRCPWCVRAPPCRDRG